MSKLKYLFVVFFVFVFSSFPAFAENGDFSITVPKTFDGIYKEEINNSFAEKFNMTKAELEDYFSKNNIAFLAVGNENKSQIRVSVFEDDFSKHTENLSVYSDKDVKRLGKQLVDDTSLSYDIYSDNSKKYIVITENSKDSGGQYTATQFITVANGKIYNISFVNSGNEFDKSNLSILQNFEIKSEDNPSKIPILLTIIIAVSIAVFAAVIVVMILGINKDRKAIKNEKEED